LTFVRNGSDNVPIVKSGIACSSGSSDFTRQPLMRFLASSVGAVPGGTSFAYAPVKATWSGSGCAAVTGGMIWALFKHLAIALLELSGKVDAATGSLGRPHLSKIALAAVSGTCAVILATAAVRAASGVGPWAVCEIR